MQWSYIMDKYTLTFKLTKFPNARNFLSEVTADPETLDSAIYERTKYFSELYKTPVKCIKTRKNSEEIKEPAGVV